MHPARLSGGQKQLLAIASVLIAGPPLLVLDEPVTLLDALARAEVDRLLARDRGPGGATVFLTSEVEDAARGTRVIVLHEGTVAWEGPPADLPRGDATLEAWGLVPPPGAGEEARQGPVVPLWQRGRKGVSEPSLKAGGLEIAVSDLHFAYDRGTPRERPVLRGADLVARPGELLGIAGANGSGKTTLIQHLNGLLPPQRGRVRVGDQALEPGVKPQVSAIGAGTRRPRCRHSRPARPVRTDLGGEAPGRARGRPRARHALPRSR